MILYRFIKQNWQCKPHLMTRSASGEGESYNTGNILSHHVFSIFAYFLFRIRINDSRFVNELFWVGSHLKWISNDSVYRSNRIRVSFVQSFFDWMCWNQLIGLFTNCPSKPSLQIHIFYCGDDEERLYEDEHLQLMNDSV